MVINILIINILIINSLVINSLVINSLIINSLVINGLVINSIINSLIVVITRIDDVIIKYLDCVFLETLVIKLTSVIGLALMVLVVLLTELFIVVEYIDLPVTTTHLQSAVVREMVSIIEQGQFSGLIQVVVHH